MDRNDVDRQLLAASRQSPELAAILAGKHDDPGPRYRRLAALVGAGLALLVVAALFVPRLAGWGRQRHESAEMDFSVYLSPIKTRQVAQGEETSPFTGFAVSIETDPPSALVSIAGVPRGEAPVLANLACRGAEKVEIRAEKAGYRPLRREVSCRADTLVKLTLRLER